MAHEPDNFLGLPPAYSNPARARYVVLPVPYEGTVSYKAGTIDGPAAIIDASRRVEEFDEELRGEFYQAGIATLPPVRRAKTIGEQLRRVKKAATPVLRAGKFLLTLGGEHSISLPLVQAAAERYRDLSVLQIDAHADLRNAYGGSNFSHACVMRRVLEITPRLCQVGIRAYSKDEHDQCPRQARRFITAADVHRGGTWIDRAVKMLSRHVYLTVDIDGFDPSCAPGTGTPEPGGLDWRQVTALIRRVARQRTIVAADIMEVRPIPPNHITEFLAARLGYKIIAYTQAK